MSSLPQVFVTDLDNTILPPSLRANSGHSLARFQDLLDDGQLAVLIYATGRHLDSALEALQGSGLPMPDYFVCDVGTRIYEFRNVSWVEKQTFADHLASIWPAGTDTAVKTALQGLEHLELQAAERNSDFKVSYYLPANVDVAHTRAEAEQRLSDAGIPALVIGSVGIEGLGLLDILPPSGGKRGAILFQTATGGHTLDDLIFAGDSGNDEDMLLSGCRAILAGNAHDDYRKELLAKAAAAGLQDRVYPARDDFLEGVLDGLRHFGIA
jgi:hydroxymethylpyrimidine pyrophosphatase-like HAD family hydrolase